MTLLDVRSLTVRFERGPTVVDDLSFGIGRREKVAMVGESGAGKSMTALAVMGLLPRGGQISCGRVEFDGVDLASAPERVRNRYRGDRIGMVFQEPMSSLHPGFSVGDQIAEVIEAHRSDMTRRALRGRVVELLDSVGIGDPDRRADEYPHTWSGGMRQRAMIAMAIANKPDLIIADEPTTALDVTVQAQILALLDRLTSEFDASLLLISHDLGVVSQVADRVIVLYAGRIAEMAPADTLFTGPRHPYSRGLLLSRPEVNAPRARLHQIDGRPPSPRSFPLGCRFHPRCELADERCAQEAPPLEQVGDSAAVACFRSGRVVPPTAGRLDAEPGAVGAELLRVDGLVVHFPRGRGRTPIRAVEGVSFEIAESEALALVGESGCGKSTTARAILRLIDIDAGTVSFRGRDVSERTKSELRSFRRAVQIVFQDPHGSLNPRRTVRQIIEAPLRIHRLDVDGRVDRVLELVGLDTDHGEVLPHELSGGQRQRVSIARALVLEPSLLVLDEPVTALDVSIQAQILNLLVDLRDRLGLAYLLIAHDLGVVRALADRIAVMYLGQIVEIGPARAVLERSTHPYTRALLASVPSRDRRGEPFMVRGEAPDPSSPPPGCRFHPRCPRADGECGSVIPKLVPRAQGWSACHFPVADEQAGSRTVDAPD